MKKGCCLGVLPRDMELEEGQRRARLVVVPALEQLECLVRRHLAPDGSGRRKRDGQENAPATHVSHLLFSGQSQIGNRESQITGSTGSAWGG